MKFHAECLAIIGLIASLAGCAHKTVAPTVADAPQSRYSHLVAADKDVTFEIVSTTLPGDKDYIPKNDNWVQYSIHVKNTGSTPVHLVNAHLVDGNGVYRDQPKSIEETYDNPGMTGATAATAGIGVLGQIAGMFIPYAGTAAGLAGAAQGPMEADAQRKFAAELKDRILPAETLDPGGEATGVYLFPIVYKPRALVIEYTVDGAPQTLRMPLTPTPSGSVSPG
jgi:archaellum component FlaG (FlaF/FlaG flagellin family)